MRRVQGATAVCLGGRFSNVRSVGRALLAEKERDVFDLGAYEYHRQLIVSTVASRADRARCGEEPTPSSSSSPGCCCSSLCRPPLRLKRRHACMMFFWYVYSVILCFDLCFCARLQSFVVFFKEFPASPYALLTTITNE
jgi:hypothetical protein